MCVAARLIQSGNATAVLTNAAIIRHMRYYGMYPNDTTIEDVRENLRPYNYGYVTEVSKPAVPFGRVTCLFATAL